MPHRVPGEAYASIVDGQRRVSGRSTTAKSGGAVTAQDDDVGPADGRALGAVQDAVKLPHLDVAFGIPGDQEDVVRLGASPDRPGLTTSTRTPVSKSAVYQASACSWWCSNVDGRNGWSVAHQDS